jgi:hypothetical protein
MSRLPFWILESVRPSDYEVSLPSQAAKPWCPEPLEAFEEDEPNADLPPQPTVRLRPTEVDLVKPL